jgi:protein SCO1/2
MHDRIGTSGFLAALRTQICRLFIGTMLLTGTSGLADQGGSAGCGGGGHEHPGEDLSALGTPFALLDGTGEVVTSAELFDRPALVYFGYTFCPDICPFDVVRNAEAIELLAERGIAVRPVFITVDPNRDTPEVVADFTGHIHPEMIGLTGSRAQIEAVAASYGVVHTVPDDADDPYYTVGHSTFSYLVLPGRGVVDRMSRTLSAEEMAGRIACVLGR